MKSWPGIFCGLWLARDWGWVFGIRQGNCRTGGVILPVGQGWGGGEGRHEACPYGGGLVVKGGGAGASRGHPFVFVTVDRRGGRVENASIP